MIPNSALPGTPQSQGLAGVWEEASQLFAIDPPLTDDLSAAQVIALGVSPALARQIELSLGLTFRRTLIPDRTLQRRIKAAMPLSPEESEKLLAAAHLATLALRVFGREDKARKWLAAPKKGLAGRTPLELATSGPGIRAVEEMLGQIDAGYFA